MSQPDLKSHPARFVAGDGTVGLRKMATVTQKAVDMERRTVSLIVSTATRDRDGDIVEPDGWQLDGYRRNPVVLWAHDSGSPPVGKAIEIMSSDGALRAVAQFTTADENPRGDMALRLYAGGYLNAFSAGFMPKRTERMQGDGGQTLGYRILEQELWEFSCVTIPSNPDALVAARGKGIDLAPWVEWAEQVLDERHGGGLLETSYMALTGKGVLVRAGDASAMVTGCRDGFEEDLRALLEKHAPPPEGAERTDFPEVGMDETPGFKASGFERMPLSECEALKGWPQIWALSDVEPFTPDDEGFRRREALAGAHVNGDTLADVVACYRLAVRHAKGADHMRKMINAERDRLTKEAEASAPVIKIAEQTVSVSRDVLSHWLQ